MYKNANIVPTIVKIILLVDKYKNTQITNVIQKQMNNRNALYAFLTRNSGIMTLKAIASGNNNAVINFSISVFSGLVNVWYVIATNPTYPII